MTAGTILRQLRTRLQRLLRHRGQTREDAEDVIQDAFLRLQVYYQQGGEVREPEAFLVRTAMRLAINSRRDTRRRVRAEGRVRALRLIDTEPAPEDLVAAEQSVHALALKLDAVSPYTREVFLLHRVDGLSYAQISKPYGMSIKAVERRIARAMLAVFQQDDSQDRDERSSK
jgi:RNA polymerase sigma-70 factor (ECF subfamily)